MELGIGGVGAGIQVFIFLFSSSRDADLHTARAAAKHELLFVLSHVSSQPMEDVIAAMRETNPAAPPPFYQLYNSVDPKLSESCLRRAAKVHLTHLFVFSLLLGCLIGVY